MKNLKENIGNNIRTLRRQMKLSQEKASEMAGFSGTYWGQLERGERNPTLETLYKIAIVLNSSVHTLTKDVSDKNDIKKNEILDIIDNRLNETDIEFFHSIILSYLKVVK